MKTTTALFAVGISFLGMMMAESSPRTANELLADKAAQENQNVTLDVAFVRPTRWEAPLEGYSFFQAMTYSKREGKPGGEILVVVEDGEVDKFTRRYGVLMPGKRPQTNALRGTLTKVGGRGFGVWLVDTTGGKATGEIQKRRPSDRRPASAQESET
jgi:hypothetical protein